MVMAFMVMVMNACGMLTRANDLVDGGCDGACAACAVSDNCDSAAAGDAAVKEGQANG